MCPGGDGMRQSFHFSDHLSCFFRSHDAFTEFLIFQVQCKIFRNHLCSFRPTLSSRDKYQSPLHSYQYIQPRVYVSRECQQDGLRIVDIETLADGYRQCAKNTTNFPVLGLIRLPSPGHTLCGICSAMRLKL